MQAAHWKVPNKPGVVSSICPKIQEAVIPETTIPETILQVREFIPSPGELFNGYRYRTADCTLTRSFGDGESVRMRACQVSTMLSPNGENTLMAVMPGPSRRDHGIEMGFIAAGLSDSLSCFKEGLCSLNVLCDN